MFVAIISALSFYLLPLLLGRLILTQFFKKNTNVTLSDWFTAGSIAFLLFYVVIHYFLNFIFKTETINQIIPIILQVTALLLLIINIKSTKKLISFLSSNVLTLTGVFSLGAFIYGLWRFDTTYPLPLNWDFFHHQTLVNQILNGSFSLIPSHLSDTFIFNGYSTLFHLLLAWPQWIFRPDILTFFWWLEFFHLLTLLAVSYYLTNQIFKSKVVATLSMVFSAFIFESFIVYNPVILIPQTLVAVFFASIAAKYFQFKHLSLKFNIHNFLFILLTHYILGALAAIILVLLILTTRLKSFLKNKSIINIILALLFLLIILVSQIQLPFNLEFLNQGEGAAFNPDFKEKFNLLKTFSGYLLLILVPLGILLSFLKNNYYLKIAILTTGILILATLLPIPYSLKFFALARFFTYAFAAYGLSFLFKQVTYQPFKLILIILMITTLSFTFVSSSNFIKSVLKTSTSIGQISQSELEGANFLKTHYQSDALLISDPATLHISEPLSGINSPGGAYMNKQNRLELESFNQTLNYYDYNPLLNIHDGLISVPPKKLLLILSGRYFIWQESSQNQKLDLAYNIWAPADLNYNNRLLISKLSENGLKKVFQNESLAIFEITP